MTKPRQPVVVREGDGDQYNYYGPFADHVKAKHPLPATTASQSDSWHPASGYRTASGKSKWRCWNESLPLGEKELLTRNGRVWLCDSFEAAKKKCDQLNSKRPC